MLSTRRITELFKTKINIEETIHPSKLALAEEVLEVVFFEQPLIKSHHTLLGPIGNSPSQPGRQWEWSDVNLLNLQVMSHVDTTDIFIYIAYSNSTVSEKVQTQHMRTYFDELCEQKGWPEIHPENRHLFSHVFIIRIGNLDEKRLLALLGPKPAFSYNHNYGMSSQDRRRTVELIRKEGIPEWSSAMLIDGIYQFWTQQEHQLYQALHQLGKTPGAEPNEKLAKTHEFQKVAILGTDQKSETESTTIVSPDFKPSAKFVKELLDRETSFEVIALAAAKGDIGFTLEMLGIGRPTASYPYIRKPQKESRPESPEEPIYPDVIPTQEQQAILDCLDSWYPKTEGCIGKFAEKLKSGQIVADRCSLFYALCPDSTYCHKNNLDIEFPHEVLEMIVTQGNIVLGSSDLFYIVEKVKPTYKTYAWIFKKVKPTKAHTWAMIKSLKDDISVYKTASISTFITAVHSAASNDEEKFTDEEIESFFMEHNLTSWNVTPSDLGYTISQKFYDYALRRPDLHRVILDMFTHEEKQFEKRWNWSIEDHYKKVSCLRNVTIKVEDLGILLSFPNSGDDQSTGWVTFLISHIFTLYPDMKTTKEHIRLCLENYYEFPLYFAIAQRLGDRLTILEISRAVDHYREKRGNHRDCTLQPLHIPRRDRPGETKPRKETISADQTILIKQ